MKKSSFSRFIGFSSPSFTAYPVFPDTKGFYRRFFNHLQPAVPVKELRLDLYRRRHFTIVASRRVNTRVKLTAS